MERHGIISVILIFVTFAPLALSFRCREFRFVICDTSTRPKFQAPAQSPAYAFSRFGPVVNVCENREWLGFGWKLREFFKYAMYLHYSSPLLCETILLFLDGYDTLINYGITSIEIDRRWRKLQTDVLISTEMTCWVGRPCNDEDIQSLYSSEKTTPSPFANSAFMGEVSAIVKIFLSNATLNWGDLKNFSLSNLTNDMNDQLIISVLGSGLLSIPDVIIRRDERQAIFGSTAYSQYSEASCDSVDRGWLVCHDMITNTTHRGCCNSLSTMYAQRSLFHLINRGPHMCDIIRNPSKTSVFSYPFSFLEARPLVWHGNGPGKPVFFEVATLAKRCWEFREKLRHSQPRLIISLSSTPGRLGIIHDVIGSLNNQSLRPDVIYLNIPVTVGDRHISEQERSVLVDLVKFYPKLRIIHGIDFGPATKLLGALPYEDDPSTLILTVDDDVIYHKETLRSYFINHLIHPNHSISSWCEELVDMEGSGNWPGIHEDRQCNGWACAWKGVLYSVGMFDYSIFNFSNVPAGCRVHDDVYISGFLFLKGIRPYNIVLDFSTALSHHIINKSLTVGGTANVRIKQKECIKHFHYFRDFEGSH